MSYFDGCKVTVELPAGYVGAEKVKHRMSTKLPGAEVSLAMSALAKKPSIESVFLPHGHFLAGAAHQETVGGPSHADGSDMLRNSAEHALTETLSEK